MFSLNAEKQSETQANFVDNKLSQQVQTIVDEVGKALLGKDHQIRLALCCLFSGGHLLIEDLPGMGKTTLSYALAKALGLGYNRIQFTSDLLPADILGISIFDQNTSQFTFHPGPIFNQLVLADEINRTTPKTQSALLEAMEERQVTIEGETRILPEPFFVIATQNPVTLAGTYPLPESQLDRFLMRLRLGYPDQQAERKLLEMSTEKDKVEDIRQCLSVKDVIQFRKQSSEVKASGPLLDYVLRLINFTRGKDDFHFGLSPRGSLAIMRSAKTWALMCGRNHVVPEDVQVILPWVVEHRLRATLDDDGHTGASLVQRLLNEVDVID
ncbi:MAG: AAA family ATPase [SAR86 cluster bacterium]|uniref:AAA family ATPase n=1 Tax=SAR86 cluster bacterium TaxID=2030880 RepID=A0A2A5BCF5_9GAMM|nr:MAG: AAA family ATPase [SAR86 cluster bacterium]